MEQRHKCTGVGILPGLYRIQVLVPRGAKDLIVTKLFRESLPSTIRRQLWHPFHRSGELKRCTGLGGPKPLRSSREKLPQLAELNAYNQRTPPTHLWTFLWFNYPSLRCLHLLSWTLCSLSFPCVTFVAFLVVAFL